MTRKRSAFTLIELLVVIAIISILAALTGAAVQKVRERGREVQCRNDLTQLETAIGQFKAKFGIYPPCYGSGPGGTFILATNYNFTNPPGIDPEFLLLQQMFPRISAGDNGLRQLDAGLAPTQMTPLNGGSDGILRTNPVYLDPNQALVFFLSGGGVFTGGAGYATNPLTPFMAPPAGATSTSRLNNGPFFEFPQSRMVLRSDYNEDSFLRLNDPDPNRRNPNHLRYQGDSIVNPRREQPWFTDPWGAPYLYSCSRHGNDYPFGTTALQLGPWGGLFSPNLTGTTPFFTGSGTSFKYMNHKTYQIISAGRDRKIGPGGAYNPGVGAYAMNGFGGDDFANFQQTPLAVSD
jgi:prepilin-type N-terminal cleavage/methylation domain-containing protein